MEEQRLASLELAQRALRGDPGWMRVPLVVERPRLAAVERPDGRAVERLHGANCSSQTVPA